MFVSFISELKLTLDMNVKFKNSKCIYCREEMKIKLFYYSKCNVSPTGIVYHDTILQKIVQVK